MITTINEFSEEIKHSKIIIPLPYYHETRPVYMFTMGDEFVKEFKSISAVCSWLGRSNLADIYKNKKKFTTAIHRTSKIRYKIYFKENLPQDLLLKIK